MHKDNEEDIFKGKIDLSLVALQSSKIHIGIIGGGKAALIKANTFLKNRGVVTVISKEFLPEFKELDNITCIKGSYDESFIYDKHLIVIAIDDTKQVSKIKEDCEKNFKVYINAKNANEGNTRLSAQRNIGEVIVGVNTLSGNPRGAVFAVEKACEELKKYEEYLELTSKLRNKSKRIENEKNSLLKFIGSQDFYFYYINNKHREILKLFYGEEIVVKLYEGS